MNRFEESGNLRIWIIALAMLLCFAVIAVKLGIEQLRDTEEYRDKIARQSVRKIRIPGRRGKIFSSNYQVLAESLPGCNLSIYPEGLRKPGRRSNTVREIMLIIGKASAILDEESPYTREKVIEHLNIRPGLPMTVFENLPMDKAARILEELGGESGVEIEEAEISRYNPFRSLAVHLLGYTRNESPSMASDRKKFFYYLPDLEGKSGMEKFGDRNLALPSGGEINLLKGEPGCRVVQVDHLGFIRETLLSEDKAKHGNHMVLTIDVKAQKIAEEALGSARGAMAVLNADTGEVLALASEPGYDLGKFYPLTREYYNSLNRNPDRPLYNRALSGTYTPGSIIKPLVALALLSKGISPEEKINCPGFASVGNARINCAALHGHGELNMLQALEKSCNVYFIEQSAKVKISEIRDVFASANLGKVANLELPNNPGTIPRLENRKRKWNIFDSALISIGQGEILITPLQAAVYTAALANGGKVMRPYLLKEVISEEGKVLFRNRPEQVSQLAAAAASIDFVGEGMRLVVNSPGGTGRAAKVEGTELHGKTGSAEIGSGPNKKKNTWFIAFCRHENVNYAAAIVVEEGVSGGSTCAPRIREFFERFLAK